ncbi:MAG TPA: hydrogenase maturation nickel metallochaperone HypA [Anaerolineaceae bacterium]|nr:hydrogenase maturation nickel metallochaperone HypA [Anaerolineaceae bacterium]
MHELAVTESILDLSIKHARKSNASRVTDIYITIGRLSSIVDDSVQFYWDLISEGTICAGAQLHFDRIPARLLCLDCGNEFVLSDQLEPCPRCSSSQVKLLTGEEFRLDSIGIEVTEEIVKE